MDKLPVAEEADFRCEALCNCFALIAVITESFICCDGDVSAEALAFSAGLEKCALMLRQSSACELFEP
jgi:hypothetical protein